MADPNPFDAFDSQTAAAPAEPNPFDTFDSPEPRKAAKRGFDYVEPLRMAGRDIQRSAEHGLETIVHGAQNIWDALPSPTPHPDTVMERASKLGLGALQIPAGALEYLGSPFTPLFAGQSEANRNTVGRGVTALTGSETAGNIAADTLTTAEGAAIFGMGEHAPETGPVRIGDSRLPPPSGRPPGGSFDGGGPRGPYEPPRAPSPHLQIGLHTPGELPPAPPKEVVAEPVAPPAPRAPLPEVRELTPRAANPFDAFDLGQARELPPEPSAPVPRGTAAKPTVIETPEDLQAATAHVRQPTPAQAEAGNYPKAHVNYQGFDVAVETPAGGTRSGVGPDGKPWSVQMPIPYGYLKRTIGADKEPLDVYLGPNPKADTVYMIDQVHADSGKFDEGKAMLGFDSEAQAREAYHAAFSDGRGPERIGALTPMTRDEFKAFVDKPSQAKPVGDLTAPTSFTTAKGSTYQAHSDGTTTRNKAFRPEHGAAEQGVQPRSERTVYVTSDDAQRLAEFQTRGTRKAVAQHANGQWGVKYLDGKDAGKFERRTMVTPKDKPAVGLTPVEIWNGGSRVHFGNEITSLNASTTRAKAEYVDEAPPFAQARREDQPKRFDIGRSLTKEEKRKTLDTLVDQYKINGLQKEFMGEDGRGREIWRYPHRPDLFEKSHITGMPVRYHVRLPDGRVAHPTELFEGYTQKHIDAEMARRQSEARQARDTVKRITDPSQQFDTYEEAARYWDNKSEASKAQSAGGHALFHPARERAAFVRSNKIVLLNRDQVAHGQTLEALAEQGWHPAEPKAQARREPDQTAIPGTEPISDKELAERRMGGRKGTEKTQKDTGDLPLFDTNAGKQKTLFKAENALPADTSNLRATPLTTKQYVKHQAVMREMRAISRRLNPSAEVTAVSDLHFLDHEGEPVGVADGVAQGKTIMVALEGNRDPHGTVRHEHVHVMRSMGLFKPAEWKALADAAHAGDWRGKHEIEKYYPHASEDVKTEEAVAQEFGTARPKFENVKNPLVRRLFQRMQSWLTQLGGAVRRIFGRKPTAAEVFDLMDRGKVGARAEKMAERREPTFQAKREEPEPTIPQQTHIDAIKVAGIDEPALRKALGDLRADATLSKDDVLAVARGLGIRTSSTTGKAHALQMIDGTSMQKVRDAALAERIRHGAQMRREPMAQARRDDGLVGKDRPFYSALERGVQELKTERAPGSQWLATIKNKQGLKPEELEATGLGQFLEENRDRPVTKAEVLDHLRDNGVQLQEHVTGKHDAEVSELEQKANEAEGRAIQYREEFESAMRRAHPNAYDVTTYADGTPEIVKGAIGDKPELLALWQRYRDANREAAHLSEQFDMLRNQDERRGPKFEEYTLPGGTNYREMKLTLPPTKATFDHWPVLRADGHGGGVYATREAAQAEAKRIGGTVGEPKQTVLDTGFRSSHFPEANIIAHARLKDRVGPNGEKILHVEELQSDWHQKGRREGYAPKDRDAAARAALDAAGMTAEHNGTNWVIRTKEGRGVPNKLIGETKVTTGHNGRENTVFAADLAQATAMATGERSLMPSKIPDAPFKKTWHELLLKRLMHYASEHGYDKIAWTPGEMQAARYDLSKKVSRVTYSPEGRGFHAYDLSGRQVMERENVKPDELPDIIGKDAADKLLNHPTRKASGNMGSHVHELSGLDLKVGGEGMKGFYDKIVPDFLNKYGKKFGAKVGKTTIDAGEFKVNRDSHETLPYRLEKKDSPDILARFKTADEAWAEAERRGGTDIPSIDITPQMRGETMRGQPLFSMRRTPEPEIPANPRDATPEQVQSLGQLVLAKPVEFMDTVIRDVQMWAAPMAVGTPEARASAKDFANVMRLARWHAGQIIRDINDEFSPAEQTAMWDRADEESVARQRGLSTEGIGLSQLTLRQREVVEGLQRDAQQAWQAAMDQGMVEGEGLPSYVPRILAEMTEAGVTRLKTEGVPGDLHGMGANLRTSSPHLRERKYETVAETEVAARAKFGGNAHVIRNINTLPLATLSLREAVAGRAFVNKIKEIGEMAADPTVSEGIEPQDGRRWFTIDHPSLKTWKPRLEKNEESGKYEIVKDEAGNPVFDKVPIYVRADFEGPMRAILSMKSGALYNASMNMKGRVMTAIMYSPLIHNGVEWGRALPAMPGKVLTFRVYTEGNAARSGLPYKGMPSHIAKSLSGGFKGVPRDYTQMQQAINDGMVPIGHGGQFQDITSAVTLPNVAPGRSFTAKLLSAVPGLFDRVAGTGMSPAIRRAIDRLGDLWHNTLLWDRVADLQMGLYVNMKRNLIAQGKDPLTAGRVAAHFANRYAGALPIEAMGHMSRKIANTVMFSRSFTVGNWGAMKDAVGGAFTRPWNVAARAAGRPDLIAHDVGGLPRDVQAQILRDSGAEALKSIRSYARRKALAIIAVDIALLYAVNSILQSAIQAISGQSDLDEEEKGYVDRFRGLLANVQDDPTNLLRPFGMAQSLTPNAWNEPDKQDRVFAGFDQDGTAIYLRPPTGKVGEEFIGWTNPWTMMSKKLSPEIKPLTDIYNNDLGFGRKVYDPYDESVGGWMKAIGASVMHIMAAQLPTASLEALGRMTGVSKAIGYDTAPPTRMDTLKTLGPLAGVTFSSGAPGGPAVGEMYQNQEEQRFRVQQAMPGIRAQIRDGDTAGAVHAMTELNVPPGLIKYYIRTTLHPETRLSGRALRDFMRQANAEEKARMDRFRQQQPAAQSASQAPNPFDAFTH
jgi:hypothetical protein